MAMRLPPSRGGGEVVFVLKNANVASEIWMLPASPVDSMREAVLTVSPSEPGMGQYEDMWGCVGMRSHHSSSSRKYYSWVSIMRLWQPTESKQYRSQKRQYRFLRLPTTPVMTRPL